MFIFSRVLSLYDCFACFDSACFGTFGTSLFNFWKSFFLAKDHWWGFSTRNAYMVHVAMSRRLSSKLLKQGYLAERLKSSFRKFYGRYGDLIQQYEVSLSRMLNDILILDQQWLPTNQTFHQFHDFDTELDLHRLWVVSMEHLQRVWHASRERLLLRTPGPVPLRTCICSTCWDQRHTVSIRHYTSLWHYYRTWHFYWIWHFTRYVFP